MSQPAIKSTLTDRYQTTIPETIRQQLGLRKRDQIEYSIGPDGEVRLTRVHKDADPALRAFLHFLAADLAQHPAQIQALTADLRGHLQALTAGVDLNLDQPLDPADE